MEAAVSAPSPDNAAGGGRSNGVRPSLSSDVPYLHLVPVRRCRNPTRLHGPEHVRRTLLPAAKPWNLTSAPAPETPRELAHTIPGPAELLFPLRRAWHVNCD